jgi:hypothetical protein
MATRATITTKTWLTAIAVSALAISAAAAVEAIESTPLEHCSSAPRAGVGEGAVFVTLKQPGDRLDAGGLSERPVRRVALLAR